MKRFSAQVSEIARECGIIRSLSGTRDCRFALLRHETSADFSVGQ